jgi:RNA polymerase sigma-70 factor (ECF subfamily)
LGREAEAEICRRFAPRVRLYGLRHLRSDDRAADLVQHVLLATLEAIRAGAVEQPDLLHRFVLGTCRNTALRIREREARLEPRPLEELVRESGAVEMAEPIDESALHHCIALLDARSRSVIRMTFQEDRTGEEIGSALGTTIANVRVLRHRAVAQLRACLERQGKGQSKEGESEAS